MTNRELLNAIRGAAGAQCRRSRDRRSGTRIRPHAESPASPPHTSVTKSSHCGPLEANGLTGRSAAPSERCARNQTMADEKNEVTPTTRFSNGGRAVIATLAAHDVDTIFGIPGTHNLEFYRHLERFRHPGDHTAPRTGRRLWCRWLSPRLRTTRSRHHHLRSGAHERHHSRGDRICGVTSDELVLSPWCPDRTGARRCRNAP